MDFGSSFYVSQEEFNLFHRTDRELYKILVMNLWREPSESMQVYAMWLWLERVGFRNVVKRVLSLPNILINEVAEETVMCLNCIKSNNLIIASESTEIPLLQSMVDKDISVQFMQENRVKAVEGVAKVVQEVCVRAFTDIMQQAMVRNLNLNSNEGQNQNQNQNQGSGSSSSSSHGNGPFWFGSIGPANVAADERTLFVTFSKGYRVEEWEVREFFVMAYGDCIEALYMQEVQPNEQPLFARIVFRMVSTIDMILRGASKAKFSINGKHVWARKFVPKRTSTTTRTNFLPNFPGESSASGSRLGS